MSGSGKSYVGKGVADVLGLTFVDIDALIEKHADKALPEIIAEIGEEAFMRIEAAATEKACDSDAQLISTGGSVVYSESAMERLKEVSRVIYLRLGKLELMDRISGNADRERRIVGLKTRGLSALIDERIPLYEKYAHVVIDLEGAELDEAVARVVSAARG